MQGKSLADEEQFISRFLEGGIIITLQGLLIYLATRKAVTDHNFCILLVRIASLWVWEELRGDLKAGKTSASTCASIKAS